MTTVLDRYLLEGESYKRLKGEWEKYGSLTIGVDFDGTLHDFHSEGDSHEQVRSLVRDMYKLGFTIIIWTAHKNHEYVAKFLQENNIPHHGINVDGVDLGWNSRKPFFSALLDDRAGLIEVYTDLRTLVDYIEHGRESSL